MSSPAGGATSRNFAATRLHLQPLLLHPLFLHHRYSLITSSTVFIVSTSYRSLTTPAKAARRPDGDVDGACSVYERLHREDTGVSKRLRAIGDDDDDHHHGGDELI